MSHANVNDLMIMIGVHAFGYEERLPMVARCISAGCERGPAVQRSVPRTADETERQFWQRVIDTVRELKRERPWDWPVSIFFDYQNTRSEADWFMHDARFNLRQKEWHPAEYGTRTQQVRALCRLADKLHQPRAH